jgi:3-oxoadipate enol-lactonase/4-carboxymuconolactone decarboxylase
MSRNSAFWDPWIPRLGHKYRIYRPDWRGQGDSSKPPLGYQHDFTALAKDAISLLDYFRLERVHWVGEASGGMIGCTLAQLAPERLSSLVLCDTPLRPVAESHKPPERDFIMTEGVRAWHMQTLSQRIDLERAQPEIIEWYGMQMEKTPPDVAAAIIEGSDRFLDDAVTSLPVPVLLLVGGKDRERAAEQRDMAAQLPHGEVEVIEGYSKGIFTLAAAECARAALGFWARLGEGGR